MQQYSTIENATLTTSGNSFADISGTTQNVTQARELCYTFRATTNPIAVRLVTADDSGFTSSAQQTEYTTVPVGQQRQLKLKAEKQGWTINGYFYFNHCKLQAAPANAGANGTITVNGWLLKGS